jgi:hypothetical protein
MIPLSGVLCVYLAVLFFGTLSPSRRASLSPIAIACLRLLTVFPDRPDFSVPCLRSCIARSTLLCAFFPYFAIEDLLGAKSVQGGCRAIHRKVGTAEAVPYEPGKVGTAEAAPYEPEGSGTVEAEVL